MKIKKKNADETKKIFVRIFDLLINILKINSQKNVFDEKVNN
jgi:hypothetical protein